MGYSKIHDIFMNKKTFEKKRNINNYVVTMVQIFKKQIKLQSQQVAVYCIICGKQIYQKPFHQFRSSCLQMFLKIGVIKNFAIFACKIPVLESLPDILEFLLVSQHKTRRKISIKMKKEEIIFIQRVNLFFTCFSSNYLLSQS